jgi:Tfp pilus assembly protein PilV
MMKPRPAKAISMRVLALAILTMFAALTAAPADAQTYAGNGPICLEQYQWGGSRYIDCSYTSMGQCQATASGLSATCITNPYYSNARVPPAYREPRRLY